MLYQILNGTVRVGGTIILNHVDFTVKSAQKIALVGKNGAGKTTLLNLIAGKAELDRDDKRQTEGIMTSRSLTVRFLEQTAAFPEGVTLGEWIGGQCIYDTDGIPGEDWEFSRERFAYETEFDRLLTGLGLKKEDKKKYLTEFSGGEQTKIRLAAMLMERPDILLLDEPTNHLDVNAVEWLEEYLAVYDKAVVCVSHDRYFLDRFAQIVYELEDGKLTRYAGNYSEYRAQKLKALELARKAYESNRQEVQRLNELIERFKNKPNKAAFARSRKKILERTGVLEPPGEDEAHIFTGPIEPINPGGKWVLETDKLKIGYDESHPLAELSLRVKKGQKIGIIGANGVGKTTLLKTLAGILPALEGKCELGIHTQMEYFDQLTAALESDKSVVEHFHDLFPARTEKEVRTTLGHFLFPGKKASVRVSDLSGGEKTRLVLSEILNAGPNLLLLDEPTNHCDIAARETLESAFKAYTGTILFISHDRYFISQVADALLVLDGREAMYYPFGYRHYMDRKCAAPGESPAAMVQARDQALIADLRAVPEAERHRLKEYSTEELYRDWQLGLICEKMEGAEAVCKKAQEMYQQLEEKYLEALYPEAFSSEKTAEHRETAETARIRESTEDPIRMRELLEAYRLQVQEAESIWTRICLEWYEIWEGESKEV